MDARSVADQLDKVRGELEHIAEQCRIAEKIQVDVGVLDTFFGEGISADTKKIVEVWSTGKGGTERFESNTDLGIVAHMHEFGYINQNGDQIPPRSFVRLTAQTYDLLAKKFVFNELDRQIRSGDIYSVNVEVAHIRAATMLRGEMKDYFRTSGAGRWAPLQDPDREGRTPNGKPLLDTEQLRDSIAARVYIGSEGAINAVAEIDV